MLNRVVKFLLRLFVGRVLREEVRIRSLKGVRQYVAAVGKARVAFMAAVGGVAFVAAFVGGLFLTVDAILELSGVSEIARLWTKLGAGVILIVIGLIAALVAFSQKRWMKMSKAYELIDAVIEPVPTVATIPKNLVRAVKGEPTVHATRPAVRTTQQPVGSM